MCLGFCIDAHFGPSMDINLFRPSTNNGFLLSIFILFLVTFCFFKFLIGNCSNKYKPWWRRTPHTTVVLFLVFEFPCFRTLHFSTILFGPKNLSYLCTLLFYLCTKNTIVSTIVYTPKFVTRKENPKQASLQLIWKPKVVLWYISFPFRFSHNFSWNVKVCLTTYVIV